MYTPLCCTRRLAARHHARMLGPYCARWTSGRARTGTLRSIHPPLYISAAPDRHAQNQGCARGAAAAAAALQALAPLLGAAPLGPTLRCAHRQAGSPFRQAPPAPPTRQAQQQMLLRMADPSRRPMGRLAIPACDRNALFLLAPGLAAGFPVGGDAPGACPQEPPRTRALAAPVRPHADHT
ncbi:MAG: hypothetical protein J3K34DRAFT_440827 [Monoraphidium minutum]|nr:MAG: hypothetical protein J3K34DRAFT_440827 [Monoraphidium minutum]